MKCSPGSLFVDVTLWFIPGISDAIIQSYTNLSKGDPYDCFLTSVPCDSSLAKAILSFDLSVLFWFETIVVYTILTMVVLVGIFGNVVNIIIFSTHNIATDSTNSLLIALSGSDLLNLISIGGLLCCSFLCFLDKSVALIAINTIFSYAMTMIRWFNILSLDFVTIIAMQRAAAVVFPFQVSTMFSHKNVKYTILILGLVCVFSQSPILIANYPRWVLHPYFDKEIILGSKWRVDYKIMVRYLTLYYTVRSSINLVLILICGSLTVIKLNQQAKSRTNLTNASGPVETAAPKKSVRETKAIKMSLAVCLVTFLVCSVGISVNGVVQIYAEELIKTPLWVVCEYSLLFLNAINSSFNFFLYVSMSEKYKSIFKSWCANSTDEVK